MSEVGNQTAARYYAKEYAPGRWHVICPDRLPLYDNAPHGKDRPLIFRDEDAALACAERCNVDDDSIVASLSVVKTYGSETGCEIQISPLTQEVGRE